jgi:molybdopterin synthase sulfur carrier subunit
MRIQVKLYAGLRQYAGGKPPGTPFEVEIEEGASLQELIECLKIPAEEAKVAFVNGVVQEMDWKLKPGDQVGVFPPIGGGATGEIVIDTWLYGDLAKYGGEASQGSFAHLEVKLPEGSTIASLLAFLEMPGEARGITFINGELSAMPGVQPDLDHRLKDNDRVAFFHPLSMWPFQYRFGVPMVDEMSKTLQSDPDKGLRHSYREGGISADKGSILP